MKAGTSAVDYSGKCMLTVSGLKYILAKFDMPMDWASRTTLYSTTCTILYPRSQVRDAEVLPITFFHASALGRDCKGMTTLYAIIRHYDIHYSGEVSVAWLLDGSFWSDNSGHIAVVVLLGNKYIGILDPAGRVMLKGTPRESFTRYSEEREEHGGIKTARLFYVDLNGNIRIDVGDLLENIIAFTEANY
ncbi:MAG: hypothetical protein ACPLSM_01855 [Thermosphaera sp.]